MPYFVKFSREFKFRALNLCAPGFHVNLIFAHTIMGENNIRHFICCSVNLFDVFLEF